MHPVLTVVLFSHSVVPSSLWPRGLQHSRIPCPSPSPRACSNSCPFSQWSHSNHLALCHPLLPLPSIFPSIRISPNESTLHIRWPKLWSFSISMFIEVNMISGVPLSEVSQGFFLLLLCFRGTSWRSQWVNCCIVLRFKLNKFLWVHRLIFPREC